MEISEIQPSDHAQVQALVGRDPVRDTATPQNPPPPGGSLGQCASVLSLAAREEGKIIAAILCYPDGKNGFLHRLAVQDPEIDQAVVRQLIDKALGKLNARGSHRCRISLPENSPQQTFWESARWTDQPDLTEQPVPSSAVVDRLAADPVGPHESEPETEPGVAPSREPEPDTETSPAAG